MPKKGWFEAVIFTDGFFDGASYFDTREEMTGYLEGLEEGSRGGSWGYAFPLAQSELEECMESKAFAKWFRERD